MQTEIATTKPASPSTLTLRQAEAIKTSLPPLRGQYPTSRDEVERVKAALSDLGQPAPPQWIAQRVVKLLSHYFVADLHPEALKGVAADWQRELSGLPEWAVDAACAWWLSRHNAKRRNKPMPGDISEQAHKEAAIVKIGEKVIENYERYGDSPPAFLK